MAGTVIRVSIRSSSMARRNAPISKTGMITAVPLFHVTGCNSQLLGTMYMGGTAVIMPVFEIGAFLRAIEEERIDTLITVPAIYWLAISQPAFADTDISCVRSVSYGGAPIAPELVARLAKAFPQARLGNGFGLTETSSVATFLPHEFVAHADSVGFPAPVCDVRLDAVLPDGTGELLIRGPNVVSGYWNKPEATAEAFAGGWLHSGDMARIDDEGLVYLVDRRKDMINRGGENVYCVEVENALAGAPGVYEAAVLGVPDEMMGEKVGAAQSRRQAAEGATARKNRLGVRDTALTKPRGSRCDPDAEPGSWPGGYSGHWRRGRRLARQATR